MTHITQHAIARYRERIDPRLTEAGAKAAIEASSRAIDVAAGIRCPIVRQGCGARLVLRGDTVVTVLPGRSGRPVVGYGA